jgi:predicted nucleotidyltransferase
MTKQKYQKELNKLSKQIIDKYRPEKIILFGSLADGKIRSGSDIDLLVVKRTKKDYWRRADEISKIIDIDLPKDIIVMTPNEVKWRLSLEDPFIEDIINNGKIIYEKTGHN